MSSGTVLYSTAMIDDTRGYLDVGGLTGLWLRPWVCLGFDTFETLKSKHETAREVGTFKSARVAAQDLS